MSKNTVFFIEFHCMLLVCMKQLQNLTEALWVKYDQFIGYSVY